jgi:hypothetical protein
MVVAASKLLTENLGREAASNDLGELAVARIIEALRTGEPVGSAELPIELVVRNSTGPVSQVASSS